MWSHVAHHVMFLQVACLAASGTIVNFRLLDILTMIKQLQDIQYLLSSILPHNIYLYFQHEARCSEHDYS